MIGRLGSLRVLSQMIAAEQIVGRERIERAWHPQGSNACVVDRRRVNSTVGRTKHMSFILIPNQGDDVQVNAWNWRPTLEFLRAQNIITTNHAELLGRN